MKKNLYFLFPNQLFKNLLDSNTKIILLEHPHFFTRLKFHKQKLLMHRASLKNYQKLANRNCIDYINYLDYDILEIVNKYYKNYNIIFIDPAEIPILDEIKSLDKKFCIKVIDSPNFFNSRTDLLNDLSKKNKLFFHQFYIKQRKKFNILLDSENKPLGSKWSFDNENREPLPKDFKLDIEIQKNNNNFIKNAKEWVNENFSDNPGNIDNFCWPINHLEAESLLDDFINKKLKNFGKFQDAIDIDNPFLYHSLISAPLNIGLLNPKDIVKKVLSQIERIPIQSIEGFIRQIIGWREYMFGIYCCYYSSEKKSNFLKMNNKLSKSFWSGKTGIEPVDISIKQLLEYAYLHHIYRLMILGNIMLLIFSNPHDVFIWFSEMFIDSYDWVMFANVYGMSQYAMETKIVTKPYFSSSKYILKMSNFKKSGWCEIWDALFWNFVYKNMNLLSSNPRLVMITKIWDKFSDHKKNSLIKTAERFIKQI